MLGNFGRIGVSWPLCAALGFTALAKANSKAADGYVDSH